MGRRQAHIISVTEELTEKGPNAFVYGFKVRLIELSLKRFDDPMKHV